MKKKQCNKCGFEKQIKEFPKKYDTKDGYAARCKICCRADCLAYDAKNRKELNKKKGTVLNYKRIVNRNYSFYYLKEHPCVECGETDPALLQFDHLRDKYYSVSKMIQRGFLLFKIIEEINKCQVLCANCHARKTSQDQNWYKDIGDKLDYETILAQQK